MNREPLSWRALVGLALGLTVGLLAWELMLRWQLTGEVGGVGVGPRLARDAGFFLPLALGVWSCARRWFRSRGPVTTAAWVSLAFLGVLLPVAGARALLQDRQVPSTPGQTPRAVGISATLEPGAEDARFLCSVAGRNADSAAQPEQGPWSVARAGVLGVMPLQAAVFPLVLLLLWIRERRRLGQFLGDSVPVLLAALLLVLCTWRSEGSKTAVEASPAALRQRGGCAPEAPWRIYKVAAIPVDIPLNAYGDHVPQGFMYVLEEELAAVREQEQRPLAGRLSPGLREDAIQPLVLRANLGECLVLRFTNRLGTGFAALRLEGLPFAMMGDTSGSSVPRIALAAGQSSTIVAALPTASSMEGIYLLHDLEEGGRRESRGLFGALVLEPAGSVFRNSGSGALSRGTGWEAIIDVPGAPGRDFREVVLLSHGMGDPETADVRLASGEPLPILDEMAGPFRKGAVGFNYRSEPFFERDESSSAQRSSNRSRQPSTPLARSYLGEPVKLRMLQAGSPEFHAYALAEPRGRSRPPQLLSPGEGLTLSGPEKLPSTPGDFSFYCRMPNHSSGGMRGGWRVLTSFEPELAPLPDRASPAPSTPSTLVP